MFVFFGTRQITKLEMLFVCVPIHIGYKAQTLCNAEIVFFIGTYMNFIGSSLKQKVLVGKVLNILKEDLTIFLCCWRPLKRRYCKRITPPRELQISICYKFQ